MQPSRIFTDLPEHARQNGYDYAAGYWWAKYQISQEENKRLKSELLRLRADQRRSDGLLELEAESL